MLNIVKIEDNQLKATALCKVLPDLNDLNLYLLLHTQIKQSDYALTGVYGRISK
jgi:hypothetical protein